MLPIIVPLTVMVPLLNTSVCVAPAMLLERISVLSDVVAFVLNVTVAISAFVSKAVSLIPGTVAPLQLAVPFQSYAPPLLMKDSVCAVISGRMLPPLNVMLAPLVESVPA